MKDRFLLIYFVLLLYHSVPALGMNILLKSNESFIIHYLGLSTVTNVKTIDLDSWCIHNRQFYEYITPSSLQIALLCLSTLYRDLWSALHSVLHLLLHLGNEEERTNSQIMVFNPIWSPFWIGWMSTLDCSKNSSLLSESVGRTICSSTSVTTSTVSFAQVVFTVWDY